MQSKTLSNGAYVALIAAIVASGLLLVLASSMLAASPFFARAFPGGMTAAGIGVAFAVLIAACVIQWKGSKRQSVALCLVGFYLISATIGILTALVLPLFGLGTIAAAAAGTIVVTVVFGIAGFVFPRFFAKIQGVLTAALFGVILVEITYMLLGVAQTWPDWVALVIFCGFIGYDFYQAVHVERTAVNAVMYATEIYLDLMNVFVNLLSIIKDS